MISIFAFIIAWAAVGFVLNKLIFAPVQRRRGEKLDTRAENYRDRLPGRFREGAGLSGASLADIAVAREWEGERLTIEKEIQQALLIKLLLTIALGPIVWLRTIRGVCKIVADRALGPGGKDSAGGLFDRTVR